MKRRSLALLLCALVALAGCTTAATEEPMRTSDQSPAAGESASAPIDLGATADNQTLSFTVSLRLPGADDLDTYLAGLNVPGSPSYRKYLKPAEFGARFGLSEAKVASIVAWLEEGGLTAEAMPQRTSVAVSG